MSNDIQPIKLPGNLTSASSRESSRAVNQNPAPPTTEHAQKSNTADTVSMTDKVSELQGVERTLAEIPDINTELVAEFKQIFDAGELEIDRERIASKVIELETGVTDPAQK